MSAADGGIRSECRPDRPEQPIAREIFGLKPETFSADITGVTGEYPMVILFPTFDGYLALILSGAGALSRGEYTRAEQSLRSVYADLRRISSTRHCRLAEFVYLALLSCSEHDYSSAVTVLLSCVGLFEEESQALPTRAKAQARRQPLDFRPGTQNHLSG